MDEELTRAKEAAKTLTRHQWQGSNWSVKSSKSEKYSYRIESNGEIAEFLDTYNFIGVENRFGSSRYDLQEAEAIVRSLSSSER